MSEPRRGLTRRTYPDQAGPSFLDRMIPGGSDPGTAPTVPDASPVPGVLDGSHVLPRPPKAGRIAGPKYDRELLQQLRDAVLFLRQRGRPTMGLIDVLDEAITQWLERQKQAVNDGSDFPPGGNLRWLSSISSTPSAEPRPHRTSHPARRPGTYPALAIV